MFLLFIMYLINHFVCSFTYFDWCGIIRFDFFLKYMKWPIKKDT